MMKKILENLFNFLNFSEKKKSKTKELMREVQWKLNFMLREDRKREKKKTKKRDGEFLR
jgi:hypothetical protein